MISFAAPLIGRPPVPNVVAAIGNTPLIKLRKASEITGMYLTGHFLASSSM